VKKDVKMKNRWRRVVLGLALVGGAMAPDTGRTQEAPTVRIGFVVDGPWQRNDEIRALFEQEITELLAGDFDVRFPAAARVDGEWTIDGVRGAVDQLLADPDVDLVLAVGVLASADAAGRAILPKPVIGPFVFDPELQGLPLTTSGTSGIPNLNYLAHPAAFDRNVQVFQEVVPFRSLAVLMSEAYVQGAPALWSGMREAALAMDIDATPVPVGRTADSALALIPPDVDAVYVLPLTQLAPGEFDRLVDRLIARRLPSFSFLGEEEVRRGILVGLNPGTFWFRLARRVALNVQRILLGEDAGTLSVGIAYGEQLTINEGTARAIEVSPPWEVITEAELLEPVTTAVERQLSLSSAVREAVDANLDLTVADHTVAAGAQSVHQARSALLPQLEISALATAIDADRAEASFGSQPQRTLTGSATATQVILSEPAWANVAIQGHLQRSRVADRERLRLDIALDAAIAYLNVLQAQTFERIQRENVQLTRTNLELARVRQVIGVSGPGEVYRWESRIASTRRAVIDANTQRNLAEMQLNRLLHRPLEEPFSTDEAGLDDPQLLSGDQRFLEYFSNRASFRLFRDFMVSEALAGSPELEGLDAAIDAQGRAYRSATNTFWAPTIAVQAGVTNRFTAGGAGTEFTPQLPPDTPDLSGLFTQPNDVDFGLGLSVSLPLFSGGSRFAERTQALDELAQLRVEREALAERIDQRIRSALHEAGSSYASIGLAEEGAEAARNNLDLVTDAYSRGTVSILELLDAQNAALVADLVAATAVYDFLIDLMNAERAIGRFDFFMTAAQRDAYFDRLEAFVTAAGAPPEPR
jgi:outer membrane protein TolC